MRTITALALVLTLAGCDPEPGEDAGSSFDAGWTDARVPGDGGGATPDADASTDASVTDAGGAASDADASVTDAGPPAPLRVLVFSRTTGFRHASIADGIVALRALATDHGWTLDDTEDASRISTASLADVDVLVFLSPTGNPLDATQEAALEAFVRGGGGWVGIHAAADCEYDWPFYGELVGAWFARHPAIQDATLLVEERDHPATAHLGPTWMRRDEWYDFRRNPRADVRVLMTIDESTYSGGEMGADHPLTWSHEIDAGRSFYTALGHTRESFAEPAFRALLGGAVEWAGRR